MIKRLNFIRAEGYEPHRNQAIERYLLDTVQRGEMILYLWANEKTVFIGKNQNAYTECRIPLLKEDGGSLARRFTGGGAVYHDKGNLNFTFVSSHEDYSIPNQFHIMMNAMCALGLNAELDGRNDVLVEGRKISGNAFYKGQESCLHHGTILIRSDPAAIEKYLSVSHVKLNSKGVKSVKSRVGNLADFRPDVNPDLVAEAMKNAFRERYPDAEFEEMREADLPQEVLDGLYAHFSNENYIFGDDVHYETEFEARFSWGTADIRLKMCGDRIEKARIYSDALDCRAVEEKERLLTGYCFKNAPDPRIGDIIAALGVNKT